MLLGFLLGILLVQGQVMMRIAVTVPVDPPTELLAQQSARRRFIILKAPQVALSWKASDDLTTPPKANTGYRLYRATRQAGPFSPITAGFLGSTTYLDRNVKRKTTYWYRTTALIKKVESKPSNVASAMP